MPMLTRKPIVETAIDIADTVFWYLALAVVAIILVSSLSENSAMATTAATELEEDMVTGGSLMGGRPCDEVYVVGEGETLHSISDKCGDPFIVERNPHIHDPDDVFPGLVIMLSPKRRP